MREITELHKEINGTGFFDFGKDAFGQLEVELENTCREFVEIVIGEVAENGKIVHVNGWRTFMVNNIVLEPGKRVYHFNIPAFQSAFGINPKCDTPAEYGGEIAPFRYVEINHYYGKVTVRRTAFYGDYSDDDAHFECSDSRLNRVWEFCRYSIKATSVFDKYIDGNRERLPYEADSYINQLGHFCCTASASYRMAKNTLDYLFEHPTWPVEWSLMMPAMVRDYVLYSGDCEALKDWLPLLPEKLSVQDVGNDGLLRPAKNVRDIIDWPQNDRDGYEMGEVNLVPNCFGLFARQVMHELTGDNTYLQHAAVLKKALRNRMIKNGMFVDSLGSTHTSLHSAMWALHFGAAEPEENAVLCEFIRSRGMRCSVYGAQFLLETCYMNGLSDHALNMMTDNGLRSWLNMLEAGATITTESWDESLKPHQDWNHAWGAAPANIIPRFFCGVRPLEPGFKKFCVEPQPSVVKEFILKHPTPYGPIEIEYTNRKTSIKNPKECLAVN